MPSTKSGQEHTVYSWDVFKEEQTVLLNSNRMPFGKVVNWRELSTKHQLSRKQPGALLRTNCQQPNLRAWQTHHQQPTYPSLTPKLFSDICCSKTREGAGREAKNPFTHHLWSLPNLLDFRISFTYHSADRETEVQRHVPVVCELVTGYGLGLFFLPQVSSIPALNSFIQNIKCSLSANSFREVLY